MSAADSDNAKLILMVIQQIPAGCVATYGQIARLIGKPKNARQVGAVLRDSTDDSVPWHRVLNSKGSISPRGHNPDCESEQETRLGAEGVEVRNGRVCLNTYQWSE